MAIQNSFNISRSSFPEYKLPITLINIKAEPDRESKGINKDFKCDKNCSELLISDLYCDETYNIKITPYNSKMTLSEGLPKEYSGYRTRFGPPDNAINLSLKEKKQIYWENAIDYLCKPKT